MSSEQSRVLGLHAVEDKPQEDEGVVAVVNFHIFHHPLAQVSKVAGFWKLALVYKTGPRSNGQSALVEPLFSHASWDAFGKPEPTK